MLSTASSAFTKIKMPIVNQLRVTGRMDEIAELWIQRTRISLACYLLGSLALILAGNVGLRIVGSKTMLLPSGELVLMLLIVGLEMHHVLSGDLVISENQNPFVIPALSAGAGTVLLSLVLTPHFGIWGMLVAQGISQASFNNWWTVRRGIRGLGIPWRSYWQQYATRPVKI